MKLRDVGYMLGLRPRPRRYDLKMSRFELPAEGWVEFAQWLHPLQKQVVPTQALVNELRTFLGEGDFAVDVGAHTGDTSVPMALAVGRSGCVLALEPNSYVYPALEANAKLNTARTNIVPLMAAAGDEEGELEFQYSDPGFCNGGGHEGISRWRHGHAFELRVRSIRLEDVLRREYAARLPRLKFIKSDAEGCDLNVLESIAGIIEEFHPYVKSEVYKHSPAAKRRELFRFFLDRGYRVHRMASEDHLRGEVLGLDDVMTRSHFDIFCVPQGCK